jgi:hypothetical protein
MKVRFLDKEYNFALEGDKAILAVCVGIAFIFWFFTKMSNEFTTEKVVKVDYVLPRGKAFEMLPAEKLVATFKGSGWDLARDYLFGAEKIVKVDLSDLRSPGLDKSTLLDKISNLTFDKKKLEITKTVPSNLYIKFVDEVSKVVPVALNADFSYKEGYFPTSLPILSPDSVTISGAAILIDTIEEWLTLPIELKEQKDTISIQIDYEPKLERLVRVSSKNVDVLLLIEKWTEKKVYPVVEILHPQDSILQVFPAKIETTFSVPLSRFNQVTASEFNLVADLNNTPMNEENNTVPVQIEKQPFGIRGLTISPNSVRFFFTDTTSQTVVKIADD